MDNKKPSSETLWVKVLEAQTKRKSSLVTKKRSVNLKIGRHFRSNRVIRVLMKRRVARLKGNERSRIGFVRRVRTLKKLVPNGESMGLDVLFKETADYIVSLQMRVRFMEIMVDALTIADE